MDNFYIHLIWNYVSLFVNKKNLKKISFMLPCLFFLTKHVSLTLSLSVYIYIYIYKRESICVVMVNMRDCSILVSKFELQSNYYIHFWINAPWKRYKPFYSSINGLNSTIIVLHQLITQVGRVFANDPGDLGSTPGRVIPKTLKMVLDTSLLSTQQYKVCIKGKVEQSRERSSTLPYTSV